MSIPPPDFRYIGLEPAPPTSRLRARALGLGALGFGAGLVASGGGEPLPVLGASVLGVGTALFVMRKAATSDRLPSLGVDYIAIVPWGVLVHSSEQPRVLRWGALESVDVRYVHEMDAATPLVRWSVVTIVARSETLVGRCHGCLSLARLEAHLDSYARESARAVALDFAGNSGAVSDFEPVFPRLLDQVRRVLRAPEQLPALGLPSNGYRGGLVRSLTGVGVARLRGWLRGSDSGSLDRRPLAAVAAAELGEHSLIEPLLMLVTSPHPFVAAVARAAALRLGADRCRVGALDELDEFVSESELTCLKSWLAGCGESRSLAASA